MARLCCPHCATILPKMKVAENEWCGCPACGEVFAVPSPETVLPVVDERDAFYPPSPEDVPLGLTTPSANYQQGVLLLLVTLTLFFVLYLGLLIGSGCLIFLSLLWGFLGLPFTFVFLVVFLYLLKGFFKSELEGKTLRVEITEADQPRLFAFLHRLCEEVGASPPHRVFLTPEVNAAAGYERTLLGLLRPTPKNLILGLGLINVLTLSEFKAVLAHEFGHFAQRSMKLSAYVYAVNRVLLEMVSARDWLDHALLRLRAQPNILGLLGHVCWGVVYGLRQMMTGLFYAINFLDKSLSRQMEFHADLMAVSVCGSEAIVRALARMDFANEALQAAANDLQVAADHKRYSRDLFFHQRDAMEHLRHKRQNPRLGEPPSLPDDPRLAPEVFDPEDGPPQMWADHPSNYDREQNAKLDYVDCPLDERPAWLVFDDAAEAREWVTWRFYRVALKARRDVELEEPEAVRTFLHAERQAVTFDPRYHGMYDDRFLELDDPKEMIALSCFEKPARAVLRQRLANLYDEELAARATAYRRHLDEKLNILAYGQKHGPDSDEPLKFRGKRYYHEDIKGLLKFIDEQLAKDRRPLGDKDRAVFGVHYQISRDLGAPAEKALRQRYTFHLALQKLLAKLLGHQEQLDSTLAFLAGQKEGVLPAETFNEVYSVFRGARDVLLETLEQADELRLPPLPHLKARARLGPLLWEGPVVGRLGQSGRSISAPKIQKLHDQLATVIDRARHMHFKSLGGILKLQEEMARRWLTQFAGERSGSAATNRQRE